MSKDRQWIELGLDALPPGPAARVRLLRQLMLAAGLARTRLDETFAPSGITTRQAALLQFVEAQDEPPRLSQVAQGLGMTHQNARQIVTALERKGLLRLEDDPQDGRAWRLSVTPQHRRLWKRRNPGDFQRVTQWTAGLADDEVRQLLALLDRVCAGLDGKDARQGLSPPAAGGQASVAGSTLAPQTMRHTRSSARGA